MRDLQVKLTAPYTRALGLRRNAQTASDAARCASGTQLPRDRFAEATAIAMRRRAATLARRSSVRVPQAPTLTSLFDVGGMHDGVCAARIAI